MGLYTLKQGESIKAGEVPLATVLRIEGEECDIRYFPSSVVRIAPIRLVKNRVTVEVSTSLQVGKVESGKESS